MQRPKLIWTNNEKMITFGSSQQKVFSSQGKARELRLSFLQNMKKRVCAAQVMRIAYMAERGSQCEIKVYAYWGDAK